MLSESGLAARGAPRRGRDVMTRPGAPMLAAWALGLSAMALGGCVANSSNPLVHIESAQSNDEGATLNLDLTNPGGRHLTVNRLTYSISHGEAMFPVATGEWTGELDLPAHGHATLSFSAPFDTAPPEAGSHLLHLNGELFFVDRTGFLGLRFMDLTHTAFQDEVDAKETVP